MRLKHTNVIKTIQNMHEFVTKNETVDLLTIKYVKLQNRRHLSYFQSASKSKVGVGRVY